MDNMNINQQDPSALKPKSMNANELEYFVFLPNNPVDFDSVSFSKENPIFRDAIASKNAGNVNLKDKKHNEAILHYNLAIDTVEGLGAKSCALALSVCYQGRAIAKAYKKNYVDAIWDASKAMELNEHNSKAYYLRAACYYGQTKYYCALQDLVQACVLERFKDPMYINLVVNIIAQIGKE